MVEIVSVDIQPLWVVYLMKPKPASMIPILQILVRGRSLMCEVLMPSFSRHLVSRSVTKTVVYTPDGLEWEGFLYVLREMLLGYWVAATGTDSDLIIE